jgi:predicted dehydrogenase
MGERHVTPFYFLVLSELNRSVKLPVRTSQTDTTMQTPSSPNGPATRREFLKTTAIASAAMAAAPLLRTPVYGQSQAPSVNVSGANSRITVGYIGVGGQGLNAHVRIMQANATVNNIAQVAVCDVWQKRVNKAKEVIGGDVKGYTDYHPLLEQKDIDAVVIATHDPIHAPASIAALEAGKHVYVEKPFTRYLGEAFAVQDAVKKSGKKLQLGSQGCSAAGWQKAAELIKSGRIGTPVWAQGYYCRNNPKGEWNYPIDADFKADGVNWDAWLGGVKKRVPLDPQYYFRWRKFYPYCAGLLGDLVPHRLNPLMVATGSPEFPKRVVCIGTKNVHTDKNTDGALERDVPEHVEILAEFPSGLTMVIAASSVAARSPGFVIYGHHASLEIGTSGERISLMPEKEFADEVEMETFEGLAPVEDIGVHHKNWLDSIREGKEPNANIDLATKVQTVISLAEMSDRLGAACFFDEKTRKITTQGGREITPITYGTLELS